MEASITVRLSRDTVQQLRDLQICLDEDLDDIVKRLIRHHSEWLDTRRTISAIKAQVADREAKISVLEDKLNSLKPRHYGPKGDILLRQFAQETIDFINQMKKSKYYEEGTHMPILESWLTQRVNRSSKALGPRTVTGMRKRIQKRK